MESLFLSIKSIKGNSIIAGYADKIIVESFSHGVSLPLYADAGNSDRTIGRPTFSEMSFSKTTDVSTPALLAACASGTNLGDVVLDMGRTDKGKYMSLIKYTMANAMISSIRTAGHPGGGSDTFSLNFTKLTCVFTQQKPDGTPKGNAQFGWDLTKSVAA
ncbi:virulence factor secretion apparatus protein [Robbsia andropogonis]|uniref:Virulence factor secretion apparatus protein n=1 Tax=Robbsia andropogonis TaxID=28092 RepID=A0A0F5K5R7_9BURK|nr:type VI secretion system tube protein Hcp [Robbsia andropogonis]KKB64882.1 virulence factor secretion apparatus protein [Robbsia andropogonis]MCP1119135.1 type VI secretion system tube protein Hcp [Robbsia andropogonis]MCP1129014.1 type VI secretion system tube protein Hcp [Robbsia andropogonis]